MRERIFCYCIYEKIPDWLRCGWMAVIPNGFYRQINHYGIVMEWLCDCKMVRPK